MSKKSKDEPKVGEYYKYTDFSFINSSLEFFKEVGKDQYATYTIEKLEKDMLFLVEIKDIKQNKYNFLTKKHCFIFLAGEKR